MKFTERLRPWLGRKSVRGALVFLLIIVAILIFTRSDKGQDTTAELALPVVSLTTATEYAGGQSLSVIGTVRAFTEAAVTSERSGRVVAVNVTLGQSVSAGAVLASLENAAERAAVLQAEGVYDAAVAAAAQSNVGVDEAATVLKNAQNSAVSTFKSSYNTTNGIVRNSIDTFFADPNSRVPGLRIDGRGLTASLNAERVAYQTLLPTWQSKSNTISGDANLVLELQYAEQSVQRTITLIDTFLTVFSTQENSSRYTDAELQSFITSFTNLRSTLIGLQSNIDNALTGLTNAEDTVRRAQLAASGGVTSAADAQVKQALGTLRAAQANLSKTILRTPVSGTVNSLSVRPGDFIGAFAPVAIVANNEALEVVTYVSDLERGLLAVGDTVLIEGEFEGRISEIAPAVDKATRKTEVRIATVGTTISNGDTVRISKEFSAAVTNPSIRVPLTAVKFAQKDGSIFTVVDDRLVEKPVTLGAILGSSVEITEGLTATDQFVVDARGLIAGASVAVAE